MTKVGGPNVFQRDAARLRNAADSLNEGAKDLIKDAKKDMKEAGVHGKLAGAHVAAAGANAIYATEKLLDGTIEALESAGHAGKAAGFAGVGVLGWAGEQVSTAGRFVAKNLAKGFGKIANMFTNVLKDGKSVTVRELAGDPTAQRFSEKMFGKAATELNKSGADMQAAWGSYKESIGHMAGSVANLTYAAGHTLAVAGNLAEAAGKTGAAGAMKLAELGVEVAQVAVEFAEKGMAGARDAAILAAKVSGATANAMALPDQGKVQVDVGAQIASLKAELEAIQAAA